jgi:uncharacterized Zn-binding protein involved in type VI secretion
MEEDVSITDAAVSMVANTRYEGSIAAFTEDRTYTLPAGTAGDVVEVALTTGDDTYELIIAGASGVSINGGSAATEWSRLFISNEFVRFRCFAANDWRVEIDGRIPQQCELFLTSTVNSHYIHASYTKVPLDTSAHDNASIGSVANDNITVRRTGKYNANVKVQHLNNTSIDAMRINVGGATEVLFVVTSTLNGARYSAFRPQISANAGTTIFAEFFQNAGTNANALGSASDKPNLLSIYELL